MLKLLSYLIRDEFNKTPFIFVDLSTALILFIPIMWIWISSISLLFLIKQGFRYVIDSTIALRDWPLLGIFVILLTLMVAIFLRGYLLMLYYDSSCQNVMQDKAQYIKNIFLCLVTSIFTAIAIIYI